MPTHYSILRAEKEVAFLWVPGFSADQDIIT